MGVDRGFWLDDLLSSLRQIIRNKVGSLRTRGGGGGGGRWEWVPVSMT